MDLSKPPQRPPGAPRVSVVIPVLNEARSIVAALESVASGFPGAQIVVVDGGSRDGTPSLVQAWAERCRFELHLLHSTPGRAAQMNCGAAQAVGDVLLFLHADTVLPAQAGPPLQQALFPRQVAGGAFRHGFQEDTPGLRMISAWSNLRSRWWRNFYGDQAMFVRREVFHGLDGFRDLPLFEDLDLSRRMRQTGETVLLPLAVRTSGRRFLQGGVRYTLWRILQLKLRYAMGSDLQQLAHDYWSDARGGGQAQSGS